MKISTLIAFTALTAACTAGGAVTTSVWAADPDNGATLAGRWCVGCHGITTADRAIDTSPPTFPQIASKRAGQPDYIVTFLAKPHAPMPPMPLSNREREDLAAFIKRLGQQARDE